AFETDRWGSLPGSRGRDPQRSVSNAFGASFIGKHPPLRCPPTWFVESQLTRNRYCLEVIANSKQLAKHGKSNGSRVFIQISSDLKPSDASFRSGNPHARRDVGMQVPERDHYSVTYEAVERP